LISVEWTENTMEVRETGESNVQSTMPSIL